MKKAHCRLLAAGFFAVAGAVAAGPSLAAVDMFLKIDHIDGESKDDKHPKEIDVLAWSWGAVGALPRVQRTDGRSFCAQSLSVTKYLDLSTAPLLAKAASGAVIANARLTVRKAGEKPLEYVLIDLSDVRVESLSTGGSGGEDRLTENVSLTFSSATVTYTPQKPDGSAGAPLTTSVPAGCL